MLFISIAEHRHNFFEPEGYFFFKRRSQDFKVFKILILLIILSYIFVDFVEVDFAEFQVNGVLLLFF